MSDAIETVLDRLPPPLLRVAGVRFYLHWTAPFGGLLMASFIHFQLPATIYLCIDYMILVLLHEAGHLLAARFLHLKVYALEVTGFNGLCVAEAPKRRRDAVVYSSGGLLMQFVLFVAALGYYQYGRGPHWLFTSCLLNTLVFVNPFLFFANLAPLRRSNGQVTDGRRILEILVPSLHPEGPPKP